MTLKSSKIISGFLLSVMLFALFFCWLCAYRLDVHLDQLRQILPAMEYYGWGFFLTYTYSIYSIPFIIWTFIIFVKSYRKPAEIPALTTITIFGGIAAIIVSIYFYEHVWCRT